LPAQPKTKSQDYVNGKKTGVDEATKPRLIRVPFNEFVPRLESQRIGSSVQVRHGQNGDFPGDAVIPRIGDA